MSFVEEIKQAEAKENVQIKPVLLKRNHNKSQIKICLCSVSEAFSKHIYIYIKKLNPKHQNTDNLFFHADINPHTCIKRKEKKS